MSDATITSQDLAGSSQKLTLEVRSPVQQSDTPRAIFRLLRKRAVCRLASEEYSDEKSKI